MAAPLASEATFRRIADSILSASKAEHTVVNFNDSQSTTLRFANNQVVQHVSERAQRHYSSGLWEEVCAAGNNRLDHDSLMATLKRAEDTAKLIPEDPEYMSPLPPQNYLNPPAYRDATARATPMDLAKRTKPVIDRCVEKGLTAAGTMTNGVSAGGIAASSGLFGYEQSTEAEFSLTASGSDSSGWCFAAHRDINSLDVRERSGRAIEKALASKNPRDLPAGHYPVIFEPAAVAGTLGGLGFALSAKSYYRGNSAFVGKLNSQVLDTRLTMKTEPENPQLMGSRFGGEGLASKPITWIENGVLKQLFYDRFTAKEHNAEPTPFPSAQVLTFNGPRAKSIDDLIAKTDRAILVTNFWYIRSVDPKDLTMTGMTRDGTFLVENGKITCGVKNFRFHDSPLRAFMQVDMATEPLEAITMERGKMLLPAVRLPDFNFSSATTF